MRFNFSRYRRITDPSPSATSPTVIWMVIAAFVASVALPILAILSTGSLLSQALVALCTVTFGAGIAAYLSRGRCELTLLMTAPISIGVIILITLVQVATGTFAPLLTATIGTILGAGTAGTWLVRHRARSLSETSEIQDDNSARSSSRSDTSNGNGTRNWSGTRNRSGTLAGVVVTLIALGLWWWATRVINLDAADAAGIITVLPWQYYAAIGCVATTLAIALTRRRLAHSLITVATIALIIMVTLLVNIADGHAVFSTGDVHIGFANAIAERGTLLQSVDARFSWPGFFTAAATISTWMGHPDTISLLYPAFITTLYLPPMVSLGHSITRSWRLGWISALCFLCANWGGQDYFSPQSIALLFYLSILALVAHEIAHTPSQISAHSSFRTALIGTPRYTPARPDGWGLADMIGAETFIIFCAAVLAVTHQLTPIALVALLMLWALGGQTRHRSAWLGAGLLVAGWFAFGAVDWWSGHIAILINGFGQPNDALAAGVSGRVRGSELYSTMQMARIGWAALFAIGGAIGWLLIGRRFPRAMLAAAVVAPVALVAGQAYGGEIVLRVFLYASPILAVLTAYALSRVVPVGGRVGAREVREAQESPQPSADEEASTAGWASAAVWAVLITTMALGLTTMRGVNVSFERTPADVADAGRWILNHAPDGATVRPLITEGAVRVDRVGELNQPPTIAGDGSAFERLLQQNPDYVMLTTTRQHYEHIVNGQPADWYPDIARRLEATGQYRLVIDSPHVFVLERLTSSGLPLSEDPGVDPIPRRAGAESGADGTGVSQSAGPTGSTQSGQATSSQPGGAT